LRYETVGCSSGLNRLCCVWLWHIGPLKFMKPSGLEIVAFVHVWEHAMIRSAKLWTYYAGDCLLRTGSLLVGQDKT
jgi:hypothetical protein